MDGVSILRPVGERLPEFPWDRLMPFADAARAHPGGIVDLSVGTPVDSSPTLAQAALAAASDAHGYPLTAGTAAVRSAIVEWLALPRHTNEPIPSIPRHFQHRKHAFYSV